MANVSPDQDRTAEHWSRRNQRVDACLRQRNRIEFIGGGVAIGISIASGVSIFQSAVAATDVITAFGFLLLSAGLAMTLALLAAHIERQRPILADKSPRDALIARLKGEANFVARMWSWYLLPMTPGLALIWLGLLAGGSVAAATLGTLIAGAAFAVLALANRRAAAVYEKQLHELSTVT